MPKKNEIPIGFEKTLSELEQAVTRLENGNPPLEGMLNKFEYGAQLTRQGQAKL